MWQVKKESRAVPSPHDASTEAKRPHPGCSERGLFAKCHGRLQFGMSNRTHAFSLVFELVAVAVGGIDVVAPPEVDRLVDTAALREGIQVTYLHDVK